MSRTYVHVTVTSVIVKSMLIIHFMVFPSVRRYPNNYTRHGNYYTSHIYTIEIVRRDWR